MKKEKETVNNRREVRNAICHLRHELALTDLQAFNILLEECLLAARRLHTEKEAVRVFRRNAKHYFADAV